MFLSSWPLPTLLLRGRDIILDGGSPNVVQMYVVNSVGEKCPHDLEICGLFLIFSACGHMSDVTPEKEGGRAKSKSIVLGQTEAQSTFSGTAIVNCII